MFSHIPTQNKVVAAARRYLGAPFHHQGRVAQGMDCAGLLVLVARDLGFEPLDLMIYDHEPDPVVLQQYLDAQLTRINPFDRDVGDVLLMCLGARSMRGHHLAIQSEIGIIHAYAPAKKVVETNLDATFARAIVGVYRWPA